MADIAERYMRDYVPSNCKASSAEVYRRALDNHILPALGGMKVGDVGREQVAELHYTMRDEPHAANAVLKIVAKMLSLAMEWGVRPHGPNPCRKVRKYRTRPRERFLTDAEYRRLGRAVGRMEAGGRLSPAAAAATRRDTRCLKGREKIGERVGKVIGKYKMAKHVTWSIDDKGVFTYGRNEASIAAEARLDGLYVIRTSLPASELDGPGTVHAYKRLSSVERAFCSLKTVDLKVRPVFHRTEPRVRAQPFQLTPIHWPVLPPP